MLEDVPVQIRSELFASNPGTKTYKLLSFEDEIIFFALAIINQNGFKILLYNLDGEQCLTLLRYIMYKIRSQIRLLLISDI